MNPDDDFDAWRMHQDGASWSEIAHEMGCTSAAAQAFAAAYEQRTDDAAQLEQNTLF